MPGHLLEDLLRPQPFRIDFGRFRRAQRVWRRGCCSAASSLRCALGDSASAPAQRRHAASAGRTPKASTTSRPSSSARYLTSTGEFSASSSICSRSCAGGCGPIVVEGQILDRQHIAARRVEAHRRLGQRGQVAQLVGRARLPDRGLVLACRLRQPVVHHDGRRQPPHPPGILHRRAARSSRRRRFPTRSSPSAAAWSAADRPAAPACWARSRPCRELPRPPAGGPVDLLGALHRKRHRLVGIVASPAVSSVAVAIVVERHRGAHIARARSPARAWRPASPREPARRSARIASAVFGPSGRWPAASTSTTRSGVSPSTAEATRLRIASGSPSASERWRSLSTTEALAGRSCFAKQRVVRQHQMHARRLDIGERAHRVLELAFERALVVHLLVELRAHPVRLVEDLKAQPPALHAALGRGRQARLVQLRGRNPDARAIRRSAQTESAPGSESVPIWRASSGSRSDVEGAPVGAQSRTRAARRSGGQQQRRHHRPAALRPAAISRPAHPRQPPQPGPPAAQLQSVRALPAGSFPTVFRWPWSFAVLLADLGFWLLAGSDIRSKLELPAASQNCIPITCW